MNWISNRKMKISNDLTKERNRQEWMMYYREFKKSKDSMKPNEKLNKWLEQQLIFMEQNQLSEECERLLIRAGIYETDVYKKFVKQAIFEVFRSILIYYRNYHTFPTDNNVPLRLDRTLDEWCAYFNHNKDGFLSNKEYAVWKKIIKKRVVCDVKKKEKDLKK